MTQLGRILIADDEETFLYSTAALLRREGYECDCAQDAATAAEVLRSADYDLLVADIKMPGNQQLELIHSLPHFAQGLPVILVTGYPSVQSAVQSIELSVTAYLIKPFEFSDFLTAVKRAIERSQIYRVVHSISERVKDWSRDLENVERELNTSPSSAHDIPLNTFLDLLLHNITSTFLDLKYLTEAALREAKEAAEATSRLKSDFLATMSHELRTPLNIIIGYTGLLLEEAFGSLAAEQRDALQRVDTSARELLELISATLDLSRLEAGRSPVAVTAVSLEGLIAELQQEMAQAPTKPAVRVEWQVAPALPPLHADRSKLRVILKNLLSNALKFTEHGQVTVAVSAQDRGIALTVSDTGIGIAPETLPVIFKMFRQGDSSMTRRYGGLGLGLYIVQQTLALLGGTIMVESEVGRGSTFRVWLPDREPAESAGDHEAGDGRLNSTPVLS